MYKIAFSMFFIVTISVIVGVNECNKLKHEDEQLRISIKEFREKFVDDRSKARNPSFDFNFEYLKDIQKIRPKKHKKSKYSHYKILSNYTFKSYYLSSYYYNIIHIIKWYGSRFYLKPICVLET